MDRLFTRSVAAPAVLLAVAALVVVAAVTAEDRTAPAGATDELAWNPCQEVFSAEDAADRVAWFFGETRVPSELVARSSAQTQHCSSAWTQSVGGVRLDHRLAVTYVFFEGEGDQREEAVWWLFYQDQGDLPTWDARLVTMSGNAEIEYFDGYVVAFSKNASGAIRAAARSAPDVDVWTAIDVDGRSANWGFDTVPVP